MFYRLYGIVASSDQPLGDIPVFNGSNVDVWIRRLPKPQFSFPMTQWFMHWYLPGGEKWLSLAKIESGYLLRFTDLADFFVTSDGNEVSYMSKHCIPEKTVQHLLLNQVIPLLINLKGGEAFHASASLTSRGVVAFAGPAGYGKSTLAGVLFKAGYPVMSDDCLALAEEKGKIYAIPAYPELRLWKDSREYLFENNASYKAVAHYTNKNRIDMKTEMYCSEAQPLKRLYDIGRSSKIRAKNNILIEDLSPQESFITLTNYAFRLDITDQNMLKRQFHFFKRVASYVSVRRLIFPKDFTLLPTVREAILADLKDLDN
jgi:hypothetical protein